MLSMQSSSKSCFTLQLWIVSLSVLNLYMCSFNETHLEKLCFTQYSTKVFWKRRLTAFDFDSYLLLIHMFGQSIAFYAFHCHILKSADVVCDSSNRPTMNDGCSFQQVLRQILSWFLS